MSTRIFAVLLALLFVVFSSFLTANPVSANYLGSGQCDEAGGSGPYSVPLQDCQTYGGIGPPQNVCFQVPWTFRYATGCIAFADTTDPFDVLCDPNGWSYQYQYNECNTGDRCLGADTAGSGFDAQGRVAPGICNASSYKEGDPNSACVSGGHYKNCCTAPYPGYRPETICQGQGENLPLCPNGVITEAGDTSCDSPQPTPTPTPPPGCPNMTCRYSETNLACPVTGLQWVTGTGCSGDNCPGCTFVLGCSLISCIPPPGATPTPTPPPPPGSGNTSLFVDPATSNQGQTLTVTATGTSSCSTNITDPPNSGGGYSNCSNAGGFTCSGGNPKDGKPCWWRWNCTAGNPGNYTASFNAGGSGCFSSRGYSVNNPCDANYYNDKTHACFFNGTNPDTGSFLNQQDDKTIPSPTSNFTAVDHDYGLGQVDATGKLDQVAGIWRGRVNFQEGNYIFHVTSDDGVTLDLEGYGRIIDQWKDQGPTTYNSSTINLPAGYRNITLRWYENGAGALIRLWWDLSSSSISGLVFVDRNADGAKQPSESCYNGAVSLFLTGPISRTEQFTSQSSCNTYNLANLPVGTYSVSISPPSGWFPTTDVTISGITLPPNKTGANFGLTDAVPWWQTKLGDVRAGGGSLTDRIPSSCTGACSAFISLTDNSAGIVSYTPSADFGSGTASTPNWRVDSGFTGTNYSYNYVDARVGRTASNFDGANPPTTTGFYKTTGDITISSAGSSWSVSSGQKIVVLVGNNLTISRKIEVAQGGFLAFYVKGNIIIDPSIGTTHNSTSPQLEGIYVADGSFQTGQTVICNPGNNRLNVAGTIVAGSLVQQRCLGPRNAQFPSFYVSYRPDLLLNAPSPVQTPSFQWQEVTP